MKLTKEDAREIADSLLAAADAVEDYLENNFNKIERAQYEYLNESFKTLARVSAFTTTVAVGLAINALEDPVSDMIDVIKKTKEKIKKLKTVGRVIRLVAGLADLAAGIMAKDPGAIVASISNINKEMNPGKA